MLPDPEGPGRREAIERVLGDHAAAVGPAVPPREAARSLRWARAALALPADPDRPLAFADERLVELALAAAGEPLAELRARRLGALDALPPRAPRAARGDARAPGSTIRAARRPQRPRCTCTRRPSATAWPSCASCSATSSTIRARALSSRCALRAPAGDAQ